MLSRLLCSTSLVCLPLATAVAAAQPLDTPRLIGVDNFRDVAGTTAAYTTANDGVMRAGVFYRSNALTLTPADQAIVDTLGISKVIDLRTPDEANTTPDILPAGARYMNINVIGTSDTGAFDINLTSAQASRTMMEDSERAFVTDPGMRSRMRDVLMELASAEDAALFHCTAGKDRTGWTAAMLQSIAGVSRDVIMQDYLATNDYTAARTAATLAQLQALSPAMAAAYEPLLGVEASYLQAGFDQIAASYGSVENYLTQGLGLDQATIYVLRGKMVSFATLPGELGLSGNAAAGAGLLNALQDSSLSGRDTDFNFFLQSAIDAGSLGGVENTVGGQVHADSASYLLRQSRQIDEAAAPYASGRELRDGESRLWMTALAGYVGTDGSTDVASSNEHNQGTLIGVTHRFASNLSARAGFGYSWGSVSSAGADADADLAFVTLGGRYAFDDLSQGLYADLSIHAGSIDYDASRQLGGGLGTAKGDTDGKLYGATGLIGYRVLEQGGFEIDPSIGIRVSHLQLDGFREHGSELALDVDDIDKTVTSLVTGLGIGLGHSRLGDWTLTPGLTVGYEHVLGDPQVNSKGSVLGIPVEQASAFDSRDLFSAGANLGANLGTLTLGAEVKALKGSDSHGLSGNLSASIAF